jgi:glutathione S-transferase
MMGLPFEHDSLSVFRHYDAFAAINPVVKAPTLVADDGTVLMESSLILDYLERLAPPERRLTPARIDEHAKAQRIVGLALAACEKAVQIVYALNLRPVEKQHQPWIDRVRGQLKAAFDALEAEIGSGRSWLFGPRPLQADISTAVAWRFARHAVAESVDPRDYTALAAFSERAEALPEFIALPLE